MLKDLKLLVGEMLDKLHPTVKSKPKGLIAIKGGLLQLKIYLDTLADVVDHIKFITRAFGSYPYLKLRVSLRFARHLWPNSPNTSGWDDFRLPFPVDPLISWIESTVPPQRPFWCRATIILWSKVLAGLQ